MRLKRKKSVVEERTLGFIFGWLDLDNFCWFGLDDYILVFYYFFIYFNFSHNVHNKS